MSDLFDDVKKFCERDKTTAVVIFKFKTVDGGEVVYETSNVIQFGVPKENHIGFWIDDEAIMKYIHKDATCEMCETSGEVYVIDEYFVENGVLKVFASR